MWQGSTNVKRFLVYLGFCIIYFLQILLSLLNKLKPCTVCGCLAPHNLFSCYPLTVCIYYASDLMDWYMPPIRHAVSRYTTDSMYS